MSYLLSDHQASVASITNSSGAQVIGESFTAFGNRRNPTTWSGAPANSDLTTIAGITREGYTFQTALGLWMGMNHMNGRVQDAVTGRFLSADPNIPDVSSTQSYNRYSYTNNNPLSYMDPSGFDPACAGGGQACLPNKPTSPDIPQVTVFGNPNATLGLFGNPGGAGSALGLGGADLETVTIACCKPKAQTPPPPPARHGFCIPNVVIQAAAGAAGGAVGGGLSAFLVSGGNPAAAAAGAVLGGAVGGLGAVVVGALASSPGQAYAASAVSGAAGSNPEAGPGSLTRGFIGGLTSYATSSAMQSSGYSANTSSLVGSTAGGATAGYVSAFAAGETLGAGTLAGAIGGAAGGATAIAVSSLLQVYNNVFGNCGGG